MVFGLCLVCDKLKILRLCGLQLITNKVGDHHHHPPITINKFTQTFHDPDLSQVDVASIKDQSSETVSADQQQDVDSITDIGDPTDLSVDDDQISVDRQIHQENNNKNLDNQQQKRSGFIAQFGGIGLTLLASLLSSSNLIIVKTLQKAGIGAPEATVFGYAGPFIPSIPLCLYFECVKKNRSGKKARKTGQENYQISQDQEEEAPTAVENEIGGSNRVSIFDSVWPLTIPERRVNAIGLVLQAFFGAGAILFRFCSLKLITVGDTAVICISSPLIVTILAHFLLREKTGVVPILMAILALTGVSIISRPPILTGKESFDTTTLIGTAFAFGSMSCAALQTIICRKIRGIHFSFQSLVSGVIGMGIPFIVALSVNGGYFIYPTHWQHIVMAVAVAFNGFGVIVGMLVALKLETAGIVCLVRSCDVLFGFIFQFIFFGVSPDIYSFVGGFLIILGVVVMAFRKYFETVPIFGGRRGTD